MSVVEQFIQSPSDVLLDMCTKEQLVQVADHYSVSLTSEDKRLKETLLKAVVDGLIAKDILSVQEEPPGSPLSANASEISEHELKLRQYSLQERQLQFEAAKLRAESESRVIQEKEIDKEIQLMKLKVELDLKKLEFEAQEKQAQREYQHQCEERNFALRKLELELAEKRLTVTPPVPSAYPSHTLRPSTSPDRVSSAPWNAGVSYSAAAAASGGEFNAPPLVVIGDSVTNAPFVPSPDTGDRLSFRPPGQPFDVSRNIRMVPPFNEREIEVYFTHFERVAVTLQWPVEVWTLLLQTVLSGKAQAVYSALSIQQSSDYNAVKTAILHAYELVPEAYRQKFRSLKKTDKLTFVEFAREKEKIFDRWCNAVNAQTKDSLREMILLEEFKNCIPDTVAMYLNDQKVTTLEHAAVCSDEFVLTHKNTFFPSSYYRSESTYPSRSRQSYRNDKPGKSPPPTTRQSDFETGGCFYCHEVGHRISDCQSLKKKNAKETQKQKLSKGSGFVRPLCQPHSKIDPVYKPFVSSGIVSLTGREQDSVPVKILRDTGSAQSFLLASTLPFSEESYCGSDVLVQGIEMGFLKVPLHTVHVKSDLISGFVKVAVCSQLPMNSIHFLVGNELAHEKVVPLPEVISKPSEHTDVDSSLAEVFPVCVVTRGQARKSRSTDLCDSFMSLENPIVSSPDSARRSLSTADGAETRKSPRSPSTFGGTEMFKSLLSLPVDRELLRREQGKDPSLAKCLVQTDQGSNFLSRLFKQVLQELSINHVISSAYHPESQGALERFHQTLKSMFRTYCHDSAKQWDDGLPLLLFAVRETIQESLGFSPADLIFGHTVRGPLKLLREKLGCETTSQQKNVLEYVSSFRARLHRACACAQKALSSAQSKMKTRFDRKSVNRSFQAGDKVLVLLPVVGSALQAKFSGPYKVESKLSETNYVICTPERRRKTRVCHINMLKRYVSRESPPDETNVSECPVSVASVAPVVSSYSPEEDGLTFRDVPVSSPRLQNTQILNDLDHFLSHLSCVCANDVKQLIESVPGLFADIPSQTHVTAHDIDIRAGVLIDAPPLLGGNHSGPFKRVGLMSPRPLAAWLAGWLAGSLEDCSFDFGGFAAAAAKPLLLLRCEPLALVWAASGLSYSLSPGVRVRE
ncbi:Retrovirus-related Pol polyprotein from transposon 412 [Merluccius polli]|uniref:Retrovirus-related Pol polyprotein from transposon 412 n=1 Tax=Merluccius polli TaxID=89951 RepID=A0AA47P943_MERPO|nr:Retrovirus-related Pol polyprotein from transposon 412 [Merluccius polli]